jgi:hypothetical protein
MNRICLIAMLATSFAAAAYAETMESTDASASNAPSEQLETGAPAAQSRAPQLGMDRFQRGQHDADARECLQLTTNNQIHHCAEKYRARLAATKAPAIAKVADSGKSAIAASSVASTSAAVELKSAPALESAAAGNAGAPKSTAEIKASNITKASASK